MCWVSLEQEKRRKGGSGVAWIGLVWIGLVWVGLDWIGLDWVRFASLRLVWSGRGTRDRKRDGCSVHLSSYGKVGGS